MKSIFERAAQRYLDAGWSAIPIRGEGKTPPQPWKAYQEQRMSSPSDFGGEWKGVGIVCGRVSGGLFVVDVDLKHEDDEVRMAFLEKLPPTLTATTGSGGKHYYYVSKFPVPSRVGVVPGVDIRGEGGYVVAPPSLHPNGESYDFDNDAPPATLNPATIGFVFEGGRNEAAAREAGRLIRRFGKDSSTFLRLQQWNQRFCVPPLGQSELGTVFQSIAKRDGTVPQRVTVNVEDLVRPLSEVVYATPPPDLIDGILPSVGLTLLVGKAKLGKSRLATQMAGALVEGAPILDRVPKTIFVDNDDDQQFANEFSNTVIYFSLEEFPEAIKRRFWQMFPRAKHERLFHLGSVLPPMGKGGEQALEKILLHDPIVETVMTRVVTGDDVQEAVESAATPRPALVVIDTLAAFGALSAGGGKGNAFAEEYAVIQRLSEISRSTRVPVLAVHHARKSSRNNVTEDPLDQVVGTLGANAVADAVIVMTGDPAGRRVSLTVKGRALPDKTLVLRSGEDGISWIRMKEE